MRGVREAVEEFLRPRSAGFAPKIVRWCQSCELQPTEPRARYCEACRVERGRSYRQERRKKKLGATALTPYITVESIGKLWGWDCHICGKAIDPLEDRIRSQEGASIDHLLARSQGGLDTFMNVKLAHRGCNQRRWYDEQRHA